MHCMSCSVEIPPEWKKVIALNVCPNCEEPIFNDFAIELMVELKEALEKMPNDPQGIAGWLLGNYKMTKIGDAKPVTQFYDGSKKQQQSSNEQNLKIAPNPLQDFIKRTGMDPGKVQQYKALAEEINGETEEEEQISVDENDLPEAQDPEFTMKVLKGMDAAGKPHKKSKPAPQLEDDGTNDLPPALQMDRLKRLQKQQDVASGVITTIGKSTSIRRAE